jgi:hypothetical protein
MPRHIAASLLLLTAGAAQAAIAPGSTGNGELFLNVYDATAKVSYAMDLGIAMGLSLGSITEPDRSRDMNDFLVVAQQEIGHQRFWTVQSDVWSGFLALASEANLRWSVVAMDAQGGTGANANRLLTTVRQGQEAQVANMTNTQLSTGIGSTQGGQYLTTVNSLMRHAPQTDYTIHGDSYSLSTDNGNGYYGKAGSLTPTFNGNAPFDASNPVGASSWFYYLLRSSSSAGARVTVDEFDNIGHDGYWGFTKVQGTDATAPGYDPSSPYLGKYLLSYTLPIYDVRTTAAFRSFAQGIGRTEYSGGLQVAALSGAAAAATLEAAAGWVTPLGVAGIARQGLPAPLQLASPVPEPGTWALLAGGLGLLLARRRDLQPAG